MGRRDVVFLGPSLPAAEAASLLPGAELRPPARRGDVYALLDEPIDAVVLIDGVFHAQPSVWPRELLAALDEGMTVYGASSMGALRAAECHAFGMIGHGTVFRWYADGVIEGDDEVALRHGDAESGWRALSEPMVNIRATVAAAGLPDDQTRRLLDEAKRTFYPERRLPAALAERRVDLKREDARSLLARVREERPERGPRRAHEVDPFRQRFATIGGRRSAELQAALRRKPALVDELMPRVRARWFAEDLARRVSGPLPEGTDALLAAWAADAGLPERPDLARWLLAEGPTIAGRFFDEIAAMLRELAESGRLGEL